MPPIYQVMGIVYSMLSAIRCVLAILRGHVRLFQTLGGNLSHSSTAMKTIMLKSGKRWLNVSHLRKTAPVQNFGPDR